MFSLWQRFGGREAGVESETELHPSGKRRWPRVLLAVFVVLLLALAGLWLARKPLASGYADRFLASKGVPARYQVADLGFGRQRLTNVVLGDPADPDLVADWLEARTTVGFGGATLTSVRGGRVRLRARLADGHLSLGTIDRLLPPPSGRAFALPALNVDVEDARVRLETPLGVAALKLAGSGRLDEGFAGTVAIVSERLASGTCGVGSLAGVFRTRSLGGKRGVTLKGPMRADRVACGGATVATLRSTIDATWAVGQPSGSTVAAQVLSGAVGHRLARAGGAEGAVTLVHGGGAAFTADGTLALREVRGGGGNAGQLRFAGKLTNAKDAVVSYRGKVAVADADAAALVPRFGDVAAGTPIAPLLARVQAAVGSAARRFSAEGELMALFGARTQIDLRALSARAASGARAVLADGEGLAWRSGGAVRLDGRLDVTGGGLPTLSARVAERGDGRRFTVTMQPYATDGARLAVTPVTVVSEGNALSVRTVATLSGPLGDGRVDGLTVPVDLVRGPGGTFLNRSCSPVLWQRIAVSGLVLDPGGVRLCPTAGAMVRLANGRVDGGASLGATRLSGRLGSTPVTLAATGARLRLGDRGFALDGVQARLGQPGRVTRIDIAMLEGRATANGIVGRFSGAGGQVGAVPLLLSDARGDWRLAGGRLALTGGLTVSDAQVDRPRLRPVPVRDVTLALGGALIEATGTVRAPTDGRLVANVRLTHNLTRGVGDATFTVPGLAFDKGLQPDQLTPVTFGVVADVQGRVTGEGRIDWTPAGVTSTGRFRTADTDLAAAFGPVEGIAGEIRFTDLLALESAPGQRFTVASINPGIPVTDGIVTFQTLRNARVQVEGARWPFSGGTLTLEPSLLDFSAAAQRRLTFRIAGMAADQFLQRFAFKNLNATGTFDGTLPMIFDANGGRIENGRLTVREGGGTLAYVGPITQKDIGFWPNVAFQALKSLRYRSLNIVMNGPLAGEMVTQVRFAGISQGAGAKRSGIAGLVVGRLQRLPFVFNIRIEAPFRGLLDSTASFYDPKRLVQRNLPRLLEEQEKQSQPPQGGQLKQPPPAKPIQPPASEKLP
ncbi:MAG: hypothetical protein JWN21_1336 [Sphingomonas bacterium]|nr:hypothetical protein [Sphingomonas bacterium]